MFVFELQFNPWQKRKLWQLKKEKRVISESFCFEPENEAEKKLGNLYIIAEIKNEFSNNSRFLNELASVIKREYYQNSGQTTERKFKKALKKINEFLIKKAGEKGEIDWLNNLNLAVFSLSFQFEDEKKWEINITKKGSIKIFFSRQKEIEDISRDLESGKALSSQVFEKISCAELLNGDKIIVLTKEVFDFFENNNLIETIALIKNRKEIKKILKKHKKALSKISGIFFFIKLEPARAVFFRKEFLKKLSIKKFPGFDLVKLFKLKTIKLKKIKKASIVKKPLLAVKKPSFEKINSLWTSSKSAIQSFLILLQKLEEIPQKIPEIWKNFKTKFRTLIFSKESILIIILILTLLIGSLVFKNEKEKQIQKAQQPLEEIKEKISQAESFLIFKDEERANLLLQSAWKETLPLTKTKIKDQAQSLKQSIEEKLWPLNKIEEIKEPVISRDFNKDDFSPEKIPEGFQYEIFSIFNSNLYALNNQSGEIIKYPSIGELEWGPPQTWTKSESLINAKSIAVDGSVWVLDSENNLLRFYVGKYQDKLELNLFPEIENAQKIFTSSTLLYIYILEPVQKRIIIIDKKGNIIKQFISEKFDDLKDFAVSENGKKIYLLNSPTIYEISF